MTSGLRSRVPTISISIGLVFFVQLLLAQSNTLDTLNHADQLRNKGAYEQALRVLEPMIRSNTLEPWETGRVWILLGSVYQDLGRYSEAQRAYQNAISLFKNQPGRETEKAVAMDNLGSVYLEIGQPETSKRLRLQVLKVGARISDHAGMARIYNNLAATAEVQKDWKEVRKWLGNAWGEASLVSNPRAEDVAAIHCNAGWLSTHDHDYEQALKHFEAALALWTEQYGMNHQLTGSGYILRGRTLALMGNARQGLEDLRTGLATIEKTAGTNVPVYFAARLAYAEALSATGSKKEGKAMRATAIRSLESFRSTSSQFPISADAFR
jgi:tetratricopeptide (TPR) repeat protein